MKMRSLFSVGTAGAALFLLHSIVPTFFNQYCNAHVIRKTNGRNTIMLTFDDGPDERYTGLLLDLLFRHQIHAVFFVVISQASSCENLINRMIKEGHMVGFHSLDHKNPMIQSYWMTRREMKKGREYFDKKGVNPICYRPPWGCTNVFTNCLVRKYGMKMILWSAMAEDWEKNATVESIIWKSRKRVHTNTILCLHDAGEKTGGALGGPIKTIDALKVLLPEWKAAGYEFVLPK